MLGISNASNGGTILDDRTLEKFRAFEVGVADIIRSDGIYKTGGANIPTQIGFDRRAKRFVIETDTLHCTPDITNTNINMVLWWQVITKNPTKDFNIVSKLVTIYYIT